MDAGSDGHNQKHMSPCIFCAIGAKEIPSAVVYEDSMCLAFLDIHPINPGHVLIIPKQHVSCVEDMSETTHAHIMRVSRELSLKIKTHLQPKRVGLMVLGFDVEHAHVHVIPLNTDQDIVTRRALDAASIDPTPMELEAMQSKLRISRINS